MVYNNITELIGKTPLVRLHNLEKVEGLNAKIIAKIESFNPGGSVKDRIALAMINDAEDRGLLKSGYTIIEPTSGNTGIGLAMVGAAKGYRVILTMPETMSIERRMILKAYGAEVVLTEGSKGMKGAIAKANELSLAIPNSFIPSQFDNMANPQIHMNTTGPEIFKDTNGDVDILVSGIGTGGTISGVGKFLKEKIKELKVVAVEPTDSAVLTTGIPGPHKIQGIGAGFIPNTLDTKIYDEILLVTNDEAFVMGRKIAKTEGLLVGISSGAALSAAVELAKKEENRGKTIVVVLPDTGERYLSTTLFND
ncbi:MAG: cysteine synthase A [Bacilli bacterium]